MAIIGLNLPKICDQLGSGVAAGPRLASMPWLARFMDRKRCQKPITAFHSEMVPVTFASFSRLVQQADCVWQQAASLQEGRFAPGTIKLTSGAAELRFDSGTNVVLKNPCELAIETADSARLLAG
jgi:hypothetical protein